MDFLQVVSNTAGTTIGTSPYDESLKRRRKGAASALNKSSIQTYLCHLDSETRTFISDIAEGGFAGDREVDPLPIIQRLSLSLSLTMNWGTPKLNISSDFFREVTVVQNEISRLRSTTGNMEDYIPLLRLSPFSARKEKARALRDRRDIFLKTLNDDLDDRISRGAHKPCIRANIILDKDLKLNQIEMTSISLTMLSAGLNTITGVLHWSIALLSERPDIQSRATEAIQNQSLAGGPYCDVEDDQKCPYVWALVKECLR